MSGGSAAPSASIDDSQAAELYAQAATLVEDGAYAEAIPVLLRVVAANPRHADGFNLLGYSSRQLELYVVARDYYFRALAIDNEHLGALEYLGELHLTLGNLVAAEEALGRLDDICFFGCDEYDALEEAIEAFMTAS